MEMLNEIENRLRKMACPLCFHADLGVTLQCTALDQECIFVADCRHCGHRFQISETSK